MKTKRGQEERESVQRVHQMVTFTNSSKLSQPFLSSKIQQNSSETEVIVLLNTRNTFIYSIKKP